MPTPTVQLPKCHSLLRCKVLTWVLLLVAKGEAIRQDFWRYQGEAKYDENRPHVSFPDNGLQGGEQTQAFRCMLYCLEATGPVLSVTRGCFSETACARVLVYIDQLCTRHAHTRPLSGLTKTRKTRKMREYLRTISKMAEVLTMMIEDSLGLCAV